MPPRTLVLFPLYPSTLPCGIAGIAALSPHQPPLPPLEKLVQLLQQLQNPNLPTHKTQKLLEKAEQLTNPFLLPSHFPQLLQNPQFTQNAKQLCKLIQHTISLLQNNLQKHFSNLSSQEIETKNALLLKLHDLQWKWEKELLENIPKTLQLTNIPQPSPVHLQQLCKINLTLNSLERLEIRGRDSAGLTIALHLQNQKHLQTLLHQLKQQQLLQLWKKRQNIQNLLHLSIQHTTSPRHSLYFTYKIAKEIGKLGDNIHFLRREIQNDNILHNTLQLPHIQTQILAHTRWASNGIISEENAHPVDNFALRPPQNYPTIPQIQHPHYGSIQPYIQCVLNGDIDNYPQLRKQLKLQTNIHTDAKIIPLWIEYYLLQGQNLQEAFLNAVQDFEGSAAIAMISNLEPQKIFLSLKGSGQAMYVGLAQDHLCFSSEIYGLVEQTPHYLKMNGTATPPSQPQTQGHALILNHQLPPNLEHIQSYYHNAKPLKLLPKQIQRAEITTRDIDRKNFEHFFLKEIQESPLSIQKTLQNKYFFKKNQNVQFTLDHNVIPPSILQNLQQKHIQKIYVVGQGTASIAGLAIASFLQHDLSPYPLQIQGLPASELSGFHLENHMENTLVIAITQSGTTTDTNNAIECAKQRGAATLAIVNRRNSDITYKADGVLYTSDGRDIEMSVASTKAFYAQVVAGALLSLKLAQHLQTLPPRTIRQEIENLQQLPQLMQQILEQTQTFQNCAQTLATKRKHWAVVGSGLNHIAAKEIRVKLSELCYKSIAHDFVEDKKHIDLSSEPLILVCAAGHSTMVLKDMAKDVAIFKAHQAIPIVFATQKNTHFENYATQIIYLPPASEKLSLILNTLAGHLWGYYAAKTIHQEALFFSQIRSLLVETLNQQPTHQPWNLNTNIQQKLKEFEQQFHQKKLQQRFQTALSPHTSSNLSLLFKYATNPQLPTNNFQNEFGIPFNPNNLLSTFLKNLNQAIDEHTRPIDAIKHQAKTVTVGTSRLELPTGKIFSILQQLQLESQIPPNDIPFLQKLQTTIQQIQGYTLYKISQLSPSGQPTPQSQIQLLRKEGIASKLPSRTETNPSLQGTKRSVVKHKKSTVTIGGTDERTIILIPLLNPQSHVSHLLLLHPQFQPNVNLQTKIELLGNDALEELQNAIVEKNYTWQNTYLQNIPLPTLLTHSIPEIAKLILQSLKT